MINLIFEGHPLLQGQSEDSLRQNYYSTEHIDYRIMLHYYVLQDYSSVTMNIIGMINLYRLLNCR